MRAHRDYFYEKHKSPNIEHIVGDQEDLTIVMGKHLSFNEEYVLFWGPKSPFGNRRTTNQGIHMPI